MWEKIVLEWKHALLLFWLLPLWLHYLSNKCSTKNSLLWPKILMMFLSVPQPLNKFHRTFHGLKITNWFIIGHENCLLTGFNFSIKILLVTKSFLFWILLWVLLNRAPTFTQLNPPPPRSFQPPPSSIHLHPAHFSLHPALCNTLNNIWTKILHVFGQFPQI